MTAPLLPIVLVVDDESRSLDAIRRTLDEDFTVFTSTDTVAARRVLNEYEVSVILCDQRMPGETGVEFLRTVREQWPDAVRIILSGYTDAGDIITGINDAGIYQYLLKPWSPDHLLATVRQAVETRRLQHRTARLDLELRTSPAVLRHRVAHRTRQVRETFGFEQIARAEGSPIEALCAMAHRVARFDLGVLVLGESGTGKELLARAIHYASPRAERAFVAENCAAMPDALLESELFGHRRGSFTGAHEDRPGLFQRADGGTVFLDEIGETSPAFQVRLLRVLQEGEVRPIGAVRPVPVDVRVIAATHRALEQRVREGLFREDLYYRLTGFTLRVPALRERPGDLMAICTRLLHDIGQQLDLPPRTLAPSALATLAAYRWPGNIRELRNELARAAVLSDEAQLQPTDFSPHLLHPASPAGSDGAAGTQTPLPAVGSLAERLAVVECALLRETLLRQRWNKTRAAEELGLSRVGLRAKMQRFGLEP